MGEALDFFFFYGSLYNYLSAMRIEPLAAAANVAVRWRPFNLRQIVIEQNSTGFVSDVKMNYFWRDVERRARHHRLPFAGRPPYPADPDLVAVKVGAIAAQEDWCPVYSRATFEEWFIGGRAPGVGDHAERILGALGKPTGSMIARAKGGEGERALNEATEAARQLGIFGAPTFAIGTEIFWGDDRLEEALAFAVSRRGD